MSTKNVISHLANKYPDWSIPSLLDFVNQVNLDVAGHDVYSMLVGRTVKKTITLSQPTTYFTGIRKFISVYSGSEDTPVVGIVTRESVGSGAIIEAEPELYGTYNAVYFKAPNEITNVLDDLDIPEKFHISHVAYGTSMYIEESESGESMKRGNWNRMCSTVWNEMNKGGISSFSEGYQ